MRHWLYAPQYFARRVLACATAAGIGLFAAGSMASTGIGNPIRQSLSNAVLGQSATFENPFADAPVNANTRPTRARVESENPYSRREAPARFDPFEIPSKTEPKAESTFEVFELPRVVAKTRAARLDPENPFHRARGHTSGSTLSLENPFKKNEHFDFEQALPKPKRDGASRLQLDTWSK